MKLFARITLLATGLLLLAHYLPSGYWLLTDKPKRLPFVFYSCISNEFLLNRYVNGDIQRMDTQGKVYEREEFENLTPLDNYMQLYKDRRMPKEINGVAVTPEKLRRDRINLRVKPAGLDSPGVALYPLFESESGRVRLEMPGDFMRLGGGVQFLDVKSNSVIADKSAKFTAAFQAAGFAFPAQLVGGNPSALKPYDEGYFLADAKGALFQLRQVKGEPEIKRLADLAPVDQRPLWSQLKPRYLAVQEQDNHEVRLVIIEQGGKVDLVIGPDYKLVTLPLQKYDPATMTLGLRGDMLNRLVTVNEENSVEAIVFDRDYNEINRFAESQPPRGERPAGRFAAMVFPFTVDFENDNSGYLGLEVTAGDWRAAALNAVWLVLAVAWLGWRKQALRRRLPELAGIALGGIFGVILLLLAPTTEPERTAAAQPQSQGNIAAKPLKPATVQTGA
jgi:hypothetical protein